MTRIAIVGGGRAATLHAEATLATPGVDLVGVGGRAGSAAALADALGIADLSLPEMVDRSEGLVIAVPSAAAEEVLAVVPTHLPVLVESPVLITPGVTNPAMAAVNLLHAPMVKKGLRAIADLDPVHHLMLRGRAVRRKPMTDIFSEPFAGVWPVLLAGAGSAASAVSATSDGNRATLQVDLADGRTAMATLEWVEPDAMSVSTELEAAGSAGVVTIALWPRPGLEIDGRPVAAGDEHPLVALGFVEQIKRFAALCAGRAEPWPPLTVGQGVTSLTRAAGRSVALGGESVPI